MEWFARYESRTELDDDVFGELVDQAVVVRLTDDPAGGRWCRVTIAVEARDLAGAEREARRAYAGLVASTVPAGAFGEPYRLTLERADAPAGYDLISTRGIAARLGVSDARVRQLSTRPGFPAPLDVPGLAGDVYNAAAVDAWTATWDRDNRGGRPRSG